MAIISKTLSKNCSVSTYIKYDPEHWNAQMNKANCLSPRSSEFEENGLPVAEGNKQSCWHLGKWKITEIRGNFGFNQKIYLHLQKINKQQQQVYI